MRLKNYSWLVLLCFALTARGQAPGTSTKTLSLSLDETIRRVLERNLALRLGQFTPQTARLNLQLAYGGYDPIFSGRAGQNYSVSSGIFDPTLNQFFRGGETTWQEEFSAGISGLLPTGARYTLESRLDRRSGDDLFQVGSNSFVTQSKAFEYRSSVGISVTQPLLRDFWIDSTRLNIRVLKKEVKMAELDLRFTTMQLVRDVANAYYDLMAARDQVEVQKMALELSEQFLSETKKKVEAGSEAPLEEKQAESRAATSRAELIQAGSTADQAENVLKALISDDFVSLDGLVLEPSEKLVAVFQPINKVESWRTGIEQRPDYLRLREQLEQQNIRLKYRQNQLYPALDVNGTYGRNGLGGTTLNSLDTIADNRFPRWGGAIILTLPFTFKAERAAYKIQKVSVEEAVLSLKQREEEIVREIDDAVKRIRSAYAAIDSTREARVYAEAALDAERKKLENGKSTNFQVLELQDDLTQARAAEIRALTDYNKSLHDLYYREGTTLERNRINLEVK